MIYLALAAGVPLVMKLLSYLWGLIALLLILIILIQKGKGGGLSAAFGGAGGGGVLGTKTGDFLTWVTIGLVIAFLFIAVLMVKFYRPEISEGLSNTKTGQYDSAAGTGDSTPGTEGGGIGSGTEDLGPTGDAKDDGSGGE